MQQTLNVLGGICGLCSAYFWWRSAYLLFRQYSRWADRHPTGFRPEGEKLAEGAYKPASTAASYHAARSNAFAALFAGLAVILTTISSFLSPYTP